MKNCKKNGIDGVELKWFTDYLSDRKQKTKFRNNISDKIVVPIGLPQGTALSVLLFILYINDIVYATKNAKVVMFADDTTLTITSNSLTEAMNLMNNELNNIFLWLSENKLMLNVEKTKWMLLSNKKNNNVNLSLKIGGKEIEKVNKIKYLGVAINDKLNMNDQIQKCISKAAQKVNMLKRMANKLTFDAKKIVYSTVIQPNFDYCSTLFLSATNDQIKRMQKIQNRGMRIILKCDFLTPKKFMLEQLGWLSVSQRIIFNSIVMVFKLKNGLVPNYICDEVLYVNNVHSVNVRNMNNFRLPKYKTDLTRKSIFYEGLKMYNELPIDIKNITNLNAFKIKCKEYVKRQIKI